VNQLNPSAGQLNHGCPRIWFADRSTGAESLIVSCWQSSASALRVAVTFTASSIAKFFALEVASTAGGDFAK
jgi:hypothetical protein